MVDSDAVRARTHKQTHTWHMWTKSRFSPPPSKLTSFLRASIFIHKMMPPNTTKIIIHSCHKVNQSLSQLYTDQIRVEWNKFLYHSNLAIFGWTSPYDKHGNWIGNGGDWTLCPSELPCALSSFHVRWIIALNLNAAMQVVLTYADRPSQPPPPHHIRPKAFHCAWPRWMHTY